MGHSNPAVGRNGDVREIDANSINPILGLGTKAEADKETAAETKNIASAHEPLLLVRVRGCFK